MTKLLDEKKILITRERVQAKEFSELIKEVGGEPIEAPLITIKCKDLPIERQRKFETDQYTWVFFTSANGVRCFFSSDMDVGKILQTARIAVVGSKTAKALEHYGYVADFIPPFFDAATMVDVFLKKYEVDGKWLLIRGNLSKMTIPHACDLYEIPYDIAEVYETTHEEDEEGHLLATLNNHSFDYMTFTSPSTIDSFCARIRKNKYPSIYTYTPVICIGETTKKRAIQAGFTQVYRANPFTIEGMLEKMIDIEKERIVRNG